MSLLYVNPLAPHVNPHTVREREGTKLPTITVTCYTARDYCESLAGGEA